MLNYSQLYWQPDILSVFNSEVLYCYQYTSEKRPTHQTLAATTGSYHFENTGRYVKIFETGLYNNQTGLKNTKSKSEHYCATLPFVFEKPMCILQSEHSFLT